MDRFANCLALIGLVTCIGCGPASKVAEPTSAASEASAARINPGHPSATDVVSQFLDEIRRGGEHSRANELLTELAQAELKRIGRAVQPIGSPDARFQVTRAETVPGEENSALVHSIWSEPNGDGTASNFQVVWAVQQEPVGWRISGLAMELAPNQDPIIIDFENGDLMAKLLAVPEQEESKAPTAESRSAAKNPNISR